MNFFFWLLIIWAGLVSMYYSDALTQFGRIQRAENNLWGTRAMYVLIGFVIVVVGLMVMFGLVDVSGDPNQLQINQLN